jgi:hypothetical protein
MRHSTGDRARKLGELGESSDDFSSRSRDRFCVTRQSSPGGEGVGNFVAQGFSVRTQARTDPVDAARRKFDREDIGGFLKLLPEQVDGVSFAM